MGQTYFLSITVNGCTSPQASSVVVVNPVPAAPTAGSNSPLCAGDDLNLTASFIATATYNWSGPGGFTTTGQNPTINGVTTAAAGTYSVTATVSGCTSTAATTSVVVNSAPVAPTAGSNSPVCVGGNINLTASGITSATYSWSGPNGFSSSLQNPVVSGVSLSEAGVYSVTATVSGCTGAAGTTTVVVNTPPAAPTAGNNGPVCEGSNLGLTASLIPTATYTWTGPNGFTSNFQNPNVLSATTAATGVYTVIATVGGCASAPATTSAIVNATPVFSAGAETNPTACLVADGTITLTGLNASTSYDLSYEFNGAPFSAGSITTNASGNYVITGLAVGSYTNFEITFAGCTGSDATVILLVDPAGPNVTVSVTDPSVPLACDGSATANISGGTSPYSQLWDDPLNQTSVTATALCDGTYCVRVTDAAGCISTACGTLTDPTCTLAVTETYTDIQCSGDMNGTISFAVSGASGAVSYSINSGGTFTGVSSYTNLGPGTYDWVVQDLAGCVVTGSITLTDPLPLALTVNSTNTNCAVNNGEIDITATGGTGALNYSVNNGASFQATGLFTGLGGATYPLLVEDANGCQATGIATIGVDGIPLIDSVITTDVTCYQGNDGTVTVYATTTTSPVVYSIDGGATFQINNPVFTSVPFGSYNIVVIEINGCQSVSAAFVNEPNPITYTAAITEEHCGLADGSMVLTTSVGLAPYTYSIDNGTTSQSGDTFNGISAGAYQVLITDSNGCSASGVEYVASLGGPAIDAVNTTSVLCNGDTNGTLTVVATGGTTPYEYSIDTGATFQTADSFTSLTPGNYQVIVTDASGCTDTSATLVTEPVALQLSMNATQALCDIDNATASVLATGGTQPYGYIWNDNQGQTAATATLLSEGIYTVLVTDANGCMITDSVEVTGTDSLFIEYQVTHESCNGLADGSIAVSVSGGTGAFTYLWNNGDTTASISGLEDGMFILEVTDSVGCSSTALVEVKTINVDCIEIPTAISPNADGVNDVWIIKGLELYPEALIEIYNKWGNLLYSNNSYQNDWDGKYQGTDLPAAVYYFIIKLDEETVHTGSLTIIR
jgi:gliding motility-associated-like protein